MGPSVLKVLCLGFILGGIQRTFAEGEATTCSSNPVELGETGEMVFHIAPHVNLTEGGLYMYIKKDGDPDALSCHKKHIHSSLQCDTPSGRFWSEGLVGHELTLVADKVTRDVMGVYILRLFVNGTWENATSCNFTIGEQRVSNSKDSSVVVPIVVSVILVGVLVGVIIGVAFGCRKRSLCHSKATQGHGQHSEGAAEKMIATVQAESDNPTAPGEDAPFIETSASVKTDTPTSPIVPTTSDDSKASAVQDESDNPTAPGEDAPFIETGVSVKSDTPTSPIVPTTSDDSKATALQVFAGGELRLLLIGIIGAGKSASGNTILGRETFKSHIGFQSSTQCNSDQAFRHNILIKVADTPGFNHTELPEEEVHTEITKGLATIAPGPHAILLVVSMRQYTKENEIVYEKAKRLFGEKMTEFMIVVFTGNDRLNRANRMLDEALLTAPSGLKQVLDDAHGRYIGFNNNLLMSERVLQGDRLIELVAKMTGGRYYTKK